MPHRRFTFPSISPVALVVCTLVPPLLTACGDLAGDGANDGPGAAGDDDDDDDVFDPGDGVAVAADDDSGRFPEEVPSGFALVDLGAVEVAGGETADLTFEADDVTGSFFIVATAPSGGFVVLLSARTPDGEEIVVRDVEAGSPADGPVVDQYFAGFAGPASSPNRVNGRPRAMAALLPNTPAIPMQPGTWTFRVGLYSLAVDENDAPANVPLDGLVHVGVVAREGPPPDEGTIDVAITVEASSGLTAESARADPVLQQALGKLGDALEPVGIRVGRVRYADAPTTVPQPLDLGGPSCLEGDVDDVFDRLRAPADAMHLVLVGAFTCPRLGGLIDAGASLAAISNGIPGVPFATRDGVIVATALKDEFPDAWSLVVAHEVGHFLGLFHTAEPLPDIYDAIDDTSEGSPEQYLMYYDVQRASTTLLTAEQGEIVRRHPLVR